VNLRRALRAVPNNILQASNKSRVEEDSLTGFLAGLKPAKKFDQAQNVVNLEERNEKSK
jgi:hypothetical protein